MKRFPLLITILNDMKQLFWLCEYVKYSGYDLVVREQACAMQKLLRTLGDMPPSELIARLGNGAVNGLATVSDLSDTGGGRKVRVDGRVWPELRRAFDGILAHYGIRTDTTFYASAGFGKYWNEVINPDFVHKLFNAAAEEMKRSGVTGLVGSQENIPLELMKDDMYGISYYDLADIVMVFENEAAAEAFAEQHPVDPSEFMVFRDGCWSCV